MSRASILFFFPLILLWCGCTKNDSNGDDRITRQTSLKINNWVNINSPLYSEIGVLRKSEDRKLTKRIKYLNQINENEKLNDEIIDLIYINDYEAFIKVTYVFSKGEDDISPVIETYYYDSENTPTPIKLKKKTFGKKDYTFMSLIN